MQPTIDGPRARTNGGSQRRFTFTLSTAGLLILLCCHTHAAPTAGTNWASYGGTSDEDHFSALNQINDRNAGRLGLVWSYDLPTMITALSTPLEIDGTLYAAVGYSNVYAFDARTGKQLWSYDPKVTQVAGPELREAWGVRGIAYSNGRIYVGTQDGRLIAIDTKSGRLVWSVQSTDLNDGHYITGAPRVFHGKVIIGNGGGDFAAARGYVTAYDERTGKRLWRFYTVPGNPANGFENKAMQMAAKTWTGEWWKGGGGATVWNAVTYDAELNRIYVGTGNGDPWNETVRSPGGGDNLFVASIIALNADTGEYLWHYQLNPGDTWDYDATNDIVLATLAIDGKARRVILDAPKNGFFYVIDRETGKLISAEPYAEVTWASKIDLTTGRPVEAANARYENGFAVLFPGSVGAHSWEAMSFNPTLGLVFIPTVHLPGMYDTRSIDPAKWKRTPAVVFDESIKLQNDGDPPAAGPPLGSIQAWNPVTQKQVWSYPLQGSINGGLLSTAGNLLFQGYADGHFTARAADTGKPLWSFDAQVGIIGQPVTYMVQGKQYVSVIAGFGGFGGAFGPLSAQFGWEYRSQRRRVLTFALDGAATLPAASPHATATPVDDPNFEVDPARAAKGFTTYSARCLPCHGMGAIAGGAAPDLRASAVPLSPDAFDAVVRRGSLELMGMPNYAELTTEDLENLRHFIRTRARAAQPALNNGAP